MICFHHNDLDGRLSAYWVWKKLIVKPGQYGPVRFIEMNYNMDFPLEMVAPDEQVVIVDYSIDPKEMIDLLGVTQDVTWIDHHRTAIKRYAPFPEILEKLLSRVPAGRLGTAEEVAACILFLASPEASYITGQCLHVNGGLYMRE